MVDLDIIDARLAHLRQCLRELQQLQRYSWEEFTGNFQIRRTAERLLQISTESLFDIGAHIIAACRFQRPQAYREIPLILAQEDILPAVFAESIASLGGFRNILVHEYLDVEPRQVYEALQNRLTDFETFARHIVKFVEEET